MRKVFSILIVLLPFLCQFALPVAVPFVTANLSIGHLVLIPFIAFFCLTKVPVEGIFKLKLYRFCGFFLFAMISAAASFLAIRYSFASVRPAMLTVLELLYYCLLLYAAKDVFNIRFGMNVYAVIACAFSLYLILQYVLFRFRGIVLPDGFKESYVFGGSYIDFFAATGKPASVFLSSRAYTLYCLPALAYQLLWDRFGFHGRPFAISLVITAGIVLSGWTLGIALSALVWAIYLLICFAYFVVHPVDAIYRVLRQGAARLCIQIFLFLASVILITLLTLNGTVSAKVLPAVKGLLTDTSLTSGFGYTSELFRSSGIRLFGCGIGNLPAALRSFGLDASAANEINSIGVVLLSGGIVGLIAFLGMLFSLLIRRTGKFGFAIALMLIVLCLYGDIAYTTIFTFYFLIAYSANDAEMSTRRFLRLS